MHWVLIILCTNHICLQPYTFVYSTWDIALMLTIITKHTKQSLQETFALIQYADTII